jgi:metal-responsive CopG/Arc/MetJ family transcriptional regulator
MARTPTRKGKPATVKLHGQRQPLAVALPPELVAEIDAVAAALERSRAKVVEFACREYVQAHRPKAAAE